MNKLILSLSLVFLSLLFTSCSGQEGPAEQMGEKVDETVESGKETMKEAVESTKEKIEETGDTIEEKAEDVGDGY